VKKNIKDYWEKAGPRTGKKRTKRSALGKTSGGKSVKRMIPSKKGRHVHRGIRAGETTAKGKGIMLNGGKTTGKRKKLIKRCCSKKSKTKRNNGRKKFLKRLNRNESRRGGDKREKNCA